MLTLLLNGNLSLFVFVLESERGRDEGPQFVQVSVCQLKVQSIGGISSRWLADIRKFFKLKVLLAYAVVLICDNLK